MKTILPGKILTVIIRDDGPFIHLGDTLIEELAKRATK